MKSGSEKMSADGAAERVPCVLIDAYIAAKTNPKISSSFEGCHGTIEHFDPHRGADGQYKVRLEVPRSKQPAGRLAPGGMFSTGEVRYSGGNVVWLCPRHVVVQRMTAVTVIPTTLDCQQQAGHSSLHDRVATRSGRVVGCVRGNSPVCIVTNGDACRETAGWIGLSQTGRTQPEVAAVSMPSILEYYSRNHDGQRSGGPPDAAAYAEPWLAGYYATLRVVIELDDGDRCFRQPPDATAAGEVQKGSGLLVVPPSQVVLPWCWRNAEVRTPSVAVAAEAQIARVFEVWRWTDAFEKLVDQVGGASKIAM
eukprot:COSAG02_NODE_9352_length_2246_cov_7.065207_2_plen_308_part_01